MGTPMISRDTITRAALALAVTAASVGSAGAFTTGGAPWMGGAARAAAAVIPVTRLLPQEMNPPAAPGRAASRTAPRSAAPAAGRSAVSGPARSGGAAAVRNRRSAAVQRQRMAALGTQPTGQMDPAFLPRDVQYATGYKPGTIVIDTSERYLYLVGENGAARRYGVGVGRAGFQWSGRNPVSMKRKWPRWTPPAAMRKRQPDLPVSMPGGPNNPLGARALYLGNTLYRIHGSNAPWTIGQAVSSGCIRMRNEDVIELYDRVKVGTPVVVLP